MLRTRRSDAGTMSWGAVVCCFSTVCVCATAILMTHMILSRPPAMDPAAAPPSAAVPGPAVAPPRAAPEVPEAKVPPAPPAPPRPAPGPPPALSKVEGNLVENGDFEELGGEGASAFEHWGYWGRWENGNYTLEAVPGRTGKYAARMSCVTPGRGGISQALKGCKPGDKLKITFWVKADNAVGGRVFLNLEGTPGDGWASMDLKPGTYDWTESTKVVTCPASNATDYRIVIFFYNKTQGDVTIDDVAAVKMAAASGRPANPPPGGDARRAPIRPSGSPRTAGALRARQ